MTDPFDLQRFLDAQSSVYPLVLDDSVAVGSKATGCGSSFPSLPDLGTVRWRSVWPSPRAQRPSPISGMASLDPDSRSVLRSQRNRGSDYLGNPRQPGRPEISFLDDLVRRGVFRSEIRGGHYEVLRREAGPEDVGPAQGRRPSWYGKLTRLRGQQCPPPKDFEIDLGGKQTPRYGRLILRAALGVRPLMADFVAKVVLPKVSKILRAVGAFFV